MHPDLFKVWVIDKDIILETLNKTSLFTARMSRMEKVAGHLVHHTFRKLLKFRLLQRRLYIQSPHRITLTGMKKRNIFHIVVNVCSIPRPHHLQYIMN